MTEELKKAIESATTDEDKKAIVAKFGDELKSLSKEELDGTAGGTIFLDPGWYVKIYNG